MKLLIVSSEFPPGPGGIGAHAHQLASHLGTLGWQISVAAPQDYATGAEIEAFNVEQPYPVVTLERAAIQVSTALRRYQALDRWIEAWRPDVILASGMRMVWLTALLARQYRFPWAAIGHGSEFGMPRRVPRTLNRWAFESAGAVVCVSYFTRQVMLAAGIQPRSETVVHNGADAQRFRILPADEVERFRRELGLNGYRLIITVGNVTPRKGQEIVIRSLPSVLARVPDAHYLVIGLPTHGEKLMQLAAHLGVADRVHLLGRTDGDTLVRLLNAADVFAMTSRYTSEGDFEGYGIAVIEAALCGKPAVVSNNSGLAEAVVEGITGVCVGEADVAGTGKALADLLTDAERRRRMGNAAHRRATGQGTWSHKAQEYSSVLLRLTQSASGVGSVRPFSVEPLAEAGAP